MTSIDLAPLPAMPDCRALRQDVRDFLADALADRALPARARSWSAADPAFSRALGGMGWIGMTWPSAYGGGDASALERYVLVEELLAAGAPVAAHWFGDRQSGAMLLRYASEAVKAALLPRMAAGDLYFCIGMSEPGAGSDLAAIRTRATPVEGGWRVNGAKIWTSGAHLAHLMIALVRTGDGADTRHDGLSQLIVDLKAPGVTVRPIVDQMGDSHFCEVFLDDVFVPADMLLGTPGDGWRQVNAELALERSGPERYLSSYPLIEAVIAALDDTADEALVAQVGHWAAALWTLRQMSLSVAGKLAAGDDPMLEASLVKEVGARFEQEVPRALQAVWDGTGLADADGALHEALHFLLGASACFSLRGGTREVLRGIIARGLGLR